MQLTYECGYKPDKHRGKIYDKIVSVLEDFKECGYIHYDNLDLKRSNTLISIMININYFDSPSSFAMVWLDELDKIRLQNVVNQKQRMKTENLLLLLSYIRVNKMGRRKCDSISNYPEVFYKQHKMISQEISMAGSTLKRCIDILEKLDIITTAPLDRYQDSNERWHTDVTVFADKYGDWETEIRNAVKLLKSKGSITKIKKGTNNT